MRKFAFMLLAAVLMALMLAACAEAGETNYVLVPTQTEEIQIAQTPDVSEPTPESTSEPTPEPTPEAYTATLGFVGDILMMTRQISDAKTETGYDFSQSFLPMKDVFESVDVMCADFEGTLAGEDAGYTQPRETETPATELNPNPTRPPMQSFNAPDELAANLFDAGIDLVTTANNHAMDRDDEGLFRTIRTLRAAGIKTVGTATDEEDYNTPCVFEVNGIKIGVVGATQVINSTAPSVNSENRSFAVTMLTEEMVKPQITACEDAGAEFIIIMVHWGYEYQNTQDSSQIKFADKLIEWGADAIIGCHSHCVQPMEWRDGERDGKTIRVPVVYSLGNFISNMSKEYTDIGAFARITITKDASGVKCTELACLPLYCSRGLTADGTHEAHRTLPCFDENGLTAPETEADESTVRGMSRAYEHVKSVCVGERDDIHLIERSEIYAGEA